LRPCNPTLSKHKGLDLSKGSILHIENFQALNFEPKDKYIFVIGHDDPSHVLAFVISSQPKYSVLPGYKREQVHIPKKTCPGLPVECWIQCFHSVHRLSVGTLQSGFERSEVSHKGKLEPEFLQRVRVVVERSDLLKYYDIEDALDAIDKDKSKI
jgi:hypothetical protein